MIVQEHQPVADKDIIDLVLKGESNKYDFLVRKYNQRLYRIARGFLNEQADIEDVMQETYIKAFQNLSKFENRALFSTWLTRILINECLGYINRNGKMQAGSDAEYASHLSVEYKTPERMILNSELKTVLEKSIETLPPKYRSVFIMREIELVSVAETAELLDISQANVKVRLNRAKEMLKDSILSSYRAADLFELNLKRCDKVAAFVMQRITQL